MYGEFSYALQVKFIVVITIIHVNLRVNTEKRTDVVCDHHFVVNYENA